MKPVTINLMFLS